MALITFERLSRAEPPPILYHYTTQEGLLGILKTDSLWATKIHFLNDSSEYALACNLAVEEIKSRLEREQREDERKRLKCLLELEVVPNLKHFNVCVVSFSEDPDSLGQWRAYGGARGYALGFHGPHIQRQIREPRFALAKCIYKKEEQQKAIEDLVLETLGNDFPTENALPIGGDFGVHLMRLAPLLKSHSFHEEKEWRVITTPVFATRLKFRPGRSTIIPYYEFVLGDKKASYLASITVGPGPERELALNAVQPLLAHWNIHEHVRAISSEVPYRNW